MTQPKWLAKGDIDGFFGLALDNLILVLLNMSLFKGLCAKLNQTGIIGVFAKL